MRIRLFKRPDDKLDVYVYRTTEKEGQTQVRYNLPVEELRATLPEMVKKVAPPIASEAPA